MKRSLKFNLFIILLLSLSSASIFAQPTVFTYQGNLKDGANPANGNYDFEFRLFDAVSAGNQITTVLARPNVPVIAGVFTVALNFGSSAFPGSVRFLEISAGPPGGPLTVLTPRQSIESTPYAMRTLSAVNAQTANNASQLGGVFADQYVLTGDPRLSDARNPLAGSPSYIQNQNGGVQGASNFNISGTGRATTYIASNNIGIGTNSPARRLHVFGPGDQEIMIESSDVGGRRWTLQSSDGDAAGRFEIVDRTAVANRLVILPNGNVGIGTTTPAGQLDVRGDVRLGPTGQLFASGGVENLRIVRGDVDSGGFVVRGEGFSCVKIGAGVYRIGFNGAFSDIPTVVAVPNTVGGIHFATSNSTGPGVVEISIWTLSGFGQDSRFHFIAIGPR